MPERNAICQLLQTIPPNYPVENLFVNGVNITGVTTFVNVDPNTGLAYFINGDSSVVVDCTGIDAIDWA